jgi:hypothetical protein
MYVCIISAYERYIILHSEKLLHNHCFQKNPCHAGRLISVVYSKCEYVTRRRLNYVRAKCIVTALTSVKMKAFHKSGQIPKLDIMNRWHRCQVWHRMGYRLALVITGVLSVNIWSHFIVQ